MKTKDQKPKLRPLTERPKDWTYLAMIQYFHTALKSLGRIALHYKYDPNVGYIFSTYQEYAFTERRYIVTRQDSEYTLHGVTHKTNACFGDNFIFYFKRFDDEQTKTTPSSD